jgi:hypothetical protein
MSISPAWSRKKAAAKRFAAWSKSAASLGKEELAAHWEARAEQAEQEAREIACHTTLGMSWERMMST